MMELCTKTTLFNDNQCDVTAFYLPLSKSFVNVLRNHKIRRYTVVCSTYCYPSDVLWGASFLV